MIEREPSFASRWDSQSFAMPAPSVAAIEMVGIALDSIRSQIVLLDVIPSVLERVSVSDIAVLRKRKNY